MDVEERCDDELIYSDEDNMIELPCMGSAVHGEQELPHYTFLKYGGKLIEVTWSEADE